MTVWTRGSARRSSIVWAVRYAMANVPFDWTPGLLPRDGLTLQARGGTGRYRSLIPIGNGFVKHHEQRKIEFGSGCTSYPGQEAPRPDLRLRAGPLPPEGHPRRRRRSDRRGRGHQQDGTLPPLRLEGRAYYRISELQR